MSSRVTTSEEGAGGGGGGEGWGGGGGWGWGGGGGGGGGAGGTVSRESTRGKTGVAGHEIYWVYWEKDTDDVLGERCCQERGNGDGLK